ncbi:MAG: ABC transporter substrate-binding protein [Candidatus Omnitrophica bacterium]|nr:ABC transporter substrate-binding protein [Candidatus Omnitrophota bacterium]
MSTALSGPAADLGINMRLGVEAGIDRLNRSNKTPEQDLELVAMDDGYEPRRTAPNIRKLIEEENVSGIIGNVGTPTAIAALPIMNEQKVPFFAAYTGAGILRKNPPDPYVINYRASYAEETAAMVEALIKYRGLRPEEFAFFTQRDGYGDSGFEGGIDALLANGLKNETDVVHARYERNTMAVENGLADILSAGRDPKAIIMVGAYSPCAKFIRLAKGIGLHPYFLNVSFVGAESLQRELGDLGEGTIITQVVPHYESDLPLVREYHRDLTDYDPSAKPSFGSLEGYIAARILGVALAEYNGPVDREGIARALLDLGDFDLGLGVPLRLAPDHTQACHHVWASVIRDNRVQPLNWEDIP